MIVQRVKGLHQLLVLAQIAILIAFFWFWFACWFALDPFSAPVGRRPYLVYCLLMAAGLFAGTQSRAGITSGAYEKSWLKHLPGTFRQICFATGTLLIFLVVAKDRLISRAFLISLMPGLYFALLLGNHWMPRIIARLCFHGSREGRILLVGNFRKAEKLKTWLERKADFGFRAVGILCETESEVHGFLVPELKLELEKTHVRGLPILGSPADLDCLIAEHAISHVILLDSPGSPGFDHRLVQTVHDRGARLLVLSNIDDAFHHPVSLVDEDGLKFFTFYREPLESPINRTLKRTLDLAVSIPILIFILPPMCALVWILQRLQSPGPLFYTHSRAGIQNRAFTLIKFRTMHVGNPDEARAATRDDNRVFKTGRWLRRLSLDELPQFINVLRGEMSVVGPRPHLVEHNDQFARVMNNYHVRAFVKPGVTGLAQVRGFRGEAKTVDDISMRLQSDMVYLENWSLMIDCAIILRTIWQMFFPPPTAY